MEINDNSGKAKVLAFYLPQFEPNDLNNRYYGEGFTEWTNVGKAKPLFRGHNQPKVPSDLGYYDLRVPEVSIKQAALAEEAGVFGFAYWHYWWSGDMELEKPAERMLKSLKPDFPFCFAWANENWYKKLWSKDKKDDILLKDQQYPGEEDNRSHFDYCLPFFKDGRYISYDHKPVFIIYRPLAFPEVSTFIKQWNKWIKDEGIANRFYFIGMMYNEDEYEQLVALGFDAVSPQHSLRTSQTYTSLFGHIRASLRHRLGTEAGLLRHYNYTEYPKTIWKEAVDRKENVIPQIIPNWDNTPRAGKRGLIYDNSTPETFGKAADVLFRGIKTKKNKLVILKSWNEWAEGNYMEPDLKYGHGYIEQLKKAIIGNIG